VAPNWGPEYKFERNTYVASDTLI